MTDFVILGCALSNMEDDAYPFAVVFKRGFGGEAQLESYILRAWQNQDEFFPDSSRETMLDLMEDLREYPEGEQSDRFFKHLRSLNFGYLRFLKDGHCQDDPTFANEVAAYFEGGSHPVSWPDSFEKL